MLGMMLAYVAAAAAQPAQPVNGAEASYREAESIKTREPLRARTLYESAARQGYAPAQSALGILLFKEGNRTGALRWLKMAADAGEPRALLIYGTALFNGDGVPANRIQGYAMVRRSAAQGLADASATQSEMELVMPKSERDAAIKLAAGPQASTPAAEAKDTKAADTKSARATSSSRTTKTASASRTRASKPAATPKAPSPAQSAVANVPASRAASGPWRIQLGAFRQPGAGQALFARLAPRLPGKQASYVPLGDLTRLIVGPYASLADANAACRALGRQQACMPVKS